MQQAYVGEALAPHWPNLDIVSATLYLSRSNGDLIAVLEIHQVT